MTAGNLRWHDRRSSYRPPEEPIDPARYGVELLEESPAKCFVERHHYSGSYPAARLRAGLFRSRPFAPAELVGVAVFSVPAQGAAIPKWLGVPMAEGVELGRFVLLDDVPGNGETWFLSRAFRALRDAKPGVRAVLSYSDPLPRVSTDGAVVMPGHVGTIYQAHNGTYLGRSKSETHFVAPDGRVLSRRSLSKIRNEEKGAAYAVERLVAAGAPRPCPFESGRAFVERALLEGPFRRVRHPGNHVYAWAFPRGPELPPSLPYPKRAA